MTSQAERRQQAEKRQQGTRPGRMTDGELRSLLLQERRRIINDAVLRYRKMLERLARLTSR
jgi:hypothetical protein